MTPPTPQSALSQVPFRDAELAAQNLARISQYAPAKVVEALAPLLADSPDPDSTLNLFERLCTSANAELLKQFARTPVLIHYAVVVFGHSQYLGETLIQNTDVFHTLQKGLDRTSSQEDYRQSFARFQSRSFETDASVLLARFKRREYIRIMLRDVLKLATLAAITAEISALSDVLIEEALRQSQVQMRERYPAPQSSDAHGRLADIPFAVLSLGKLGGEELNYSSDVDLFFLYGEAGQDAEHAVATREYFIRLSQQITEMLSRPTREGAVFRIDLRLRPQGGEGEPAVGIREALRYYGEVAADWELQAMIKVRHSAGELALARQFIRAVQPYVYKENLNFAAIETALETRQKIGARQQRRAAASKIAAGIDVKLDRGGIRDIEFLVQCLQRVWGGKERWLRSGGTLFALQKLHDKGHLAAKDFQELNSAYTFLRVLEHRLQLRRGQQTHRVPTDGADLRQLFLAAEAGDARNFDAQTFQFQIRDRMSAVAAIYERVIHNQQTQQEPEAGFVLTPIGGELGREPNLAQLLERIALDAPELHRAICDAHLQGHARRNLQKFLSAAFTTSERYASLLENEAGVEQALTLFQTSDFLTDLLARHPEDVAQLASRGEPGVGELFAPTAQQDPMVARVLASSGAREQRLALLRREYRRRTLQIGARDVLELRGVEDSLLEASDAADAAFETALRASDAPEGLGVFALGRLGTREFDIGSDADVVFVRTEDTDAAAALRAAEQVMQALSAYTAEGTVFSVDTRLRPRGGEGELVVTPQQLKLYFKEEAQSWEALSYTKLRQVAGPASLADELSAIFKEAAARFRVPGFAEEVRDMRRRIEQSTVRDPRVQKTTLRAPDELNFKSDAGGFYDIDFISTYLSVLHGVFPDGATAARITVLAEAQALSPEQARRLLESARLIRTVDHALRLVSGKARKSLPASEQVLETVEYLVAGLLQMRQGVNLRDELPRTFRTVRAIYEQLVV